MNRNPTTKSSPTHRRIAVIIAAAGRGERFDPANPKTWAHLAGQTLVERAWRSFCPDSLGAASQKCLVERIGIAVGEAHMEEAERMVTVCPIPLTIVQGGETRGQSVRQVLAKVPEAIEIIAVHDAARPFWPLDKWDELVKEASAAGGAIPAVRVNDTLKHDADSGLETVNRSALWTAQTPQVFRADLLREAYKTAKQLGIDATDDADLVQRVGGKVRIVASTATNLKITTQADWQLAKAMTDHTNSSVLRCGHGYDVHRLGGPGALMLGGVRLAETGGLIGHSDGDVLLHAICDALLGAAALGDIGRHFPPTDQKYKGCDSRELLRATVEILRASNFIPCQIDATVAAEAPRLAAHITAMRETIASDLGLNVDAVSVKATTTEGLGFVGRREGIAAHAVVMIQQRPRGAT